MEEQIYFEQMRLYDRLEDRRSVEKQCLKLGNAKHHFKEVRKPMERIRKGTMGQGKQGRSRPALDRKTSSATSAMSSTMCTHVLHMQRTAGNRAVGQWMGRSPGPATTIQMMRNKDQFLTQYTPQEEQAEILQLIADQLEQHQSLNSENDANGQLRLQALKQLDTHIHRWMNTFVQRKINEVPNGALLMSVLKESEDEHRKLVKEIAQQKTLVPIDTTGMEKGSIETVHTIWREIVEGTGNIKISEKTDGFRDRMLAAIAKLLQGANGRKLIAELNKAQDSDKKQIILSSDFATELSGTGILNTTSNEAIPRSELESKDKSYNFKPATEKELSEVDSSYIPEYVGEVGDASAINRFLHENRGQPYFKFNGKVYKTGQATGSLVRINNEGMKTMVGQANQEIATPEFVTVGHELGHASRFLTGMVPDSFAGVDQFGVGGKADQKLWHNSEEYLNINSVENEVRSDHGIGKRKYHVGSVDDVNKQVLYERYDLKRTALFSRFEWAVRQLFEHQEANKLLRAEFVEPQADFGDPDAIKLLMGKLEGLEPILTALEPLKGKTPNDLYAKANKGVKARLDNDEPFQTYLILFEQAIEQAPLDGLAAELARLYELAKGRSMSMELKAASLLEDVDFDFSF